MAEPVFSQKYEIKGSEVTLTAISSFSPDIKTDTRLELGTRYVVGLLAGLDIFYNISRSRFESIYGSKKSISEASNIKPFSISLCFKSINVIIAFELLATQASPYIVSVGCAITPILR